METDWFDEFFAEGMVTDIVAQLKSGKEATVFICRGGAASDAKLVAVKYFKQRKGRGFQNRADYTHGRVIVSSRARRAVTNKSRFGQRVEESLWVDHEFDMLCRLHDAGTDVPRPLGATDCAILMEFIGGEDGPAPQLRELQPTAADARAMFDRLIWNVERFLANNVIHADLSPYNILVHGGAARIIDLPQAVDARTNAHARDLLVRDVSVLCRHFSRFGVKADGERLSGGLWRRFLRAQL